MFSAPGSIKLVEQGHSYWADQAVTRRLFGEPKDIHTAPASIRTNVYQNALRDKRIARMRRGHDIYTEGRQFVTAAITERAIVVEGLDEPPRYFLQHGFGYQCHDRAKPHHHRRHGRADIGWEAKNGHPTV
ncbi:hypothetical protein [Streptomyces sp. NPDC026589]|uniref:hypothetical protein n=1 Tax=Streptomyces sp. NPDC026589 TaxID=3155609 RepID=UPI0033E9F910